jgi:hypothetical protein
MTSIPIAQTQVVADKAKEYGMNKPTPFTGDRTKIRQFSQDCLGYLDMSQGIYNTDRLKIRFILSYMNNGEAANWKEYYLGTLEDLNTGMKQAESSKKKVDLARFAYTTIRALTKEQRESFTKMVMEDKDGEDF